MQISITGRHFDLTEEHKEYAQKRLKQLKKYFDGVMDVHVILSKEKHREIAEITIHVQGMTMHGEEQTDAIFSSIDLVMNKIEKQVRRYKERIRDRRKRGMNGEARAMRYKTDVLSGEQLEQGTQAPQVIRTRTVAMKPLSLDEAVMQMDLMNQDFLVFRNSRSESINALYRRPDGDYDLVEPE